MNSVKKNLYRKAGNAYVICKRKTEEIKGSEGLEQILLIAGACVIGALLIAGLYLLVKSNVLPTINQKVSDFFNYGG